MSEAELMKEHHTEGRRRKEGKKGKGYMLKINTSSTESNSPSGYHHTVYISYRCNSRCCVI
jgi:hypothetical protein